jgi:hypothetical protein
MDDCALSQKEDSHILLIIIIISMFAIIFAFLSKINMDIVMITIRLKNVVGISRFDPPPSYAIG